MAEFFKQGGDKWCYRPKKTKKKKVDYAKRHMSDWTMDTPEVVDFIECGGDIWALLGPDKAPTQLVIDPSPA